MFEFFKAIKYIISLDRLEYGALKRDTKKEKDKFFIILSNIIIVVAIVLLFYKLFLVSLVLIICLMTFAFIAHYLKLYRVLQNQMGNSFFRNKKS